jgi:serine/threonine protein kinase
MPSRDSAVADDMDDVLPAKLGRYRVARRLGRGGMGEVLLATDPSGQWVAIKRILPALSDKQNVINMLLDEARITAMIRHEHVVTVHNLEEVDGEHLLVMEFVDGQSLGRLIKKMRKTNERFSTEEACYLVERILLGLHAAHTQTDDRGEPAHIVHRDVSPQNVLLGFGGEVKVIDFGIARARERIEVTTGAQVKGKLRYMAPEQIKPSLADSGIDHRIDVFAAGIVLFELLAMRPRFDADSDIGIIDKILEEPNPDLCAEGLIDRELQNTLDKALHKERQRRPKDAAALALRLRTWLDKRLPDGTTAVQERLQQRLQHHFRVEDDHHKTTIQDMPVPVLRRRQTTARDHDDDAAHEHTKTALRPRRLPPPPPAPAVVVAPARRRAWWPLTAAAALATVGLAWWLWPMPNTAVAAVVATGPAALIIEATPASALIGRAGGNEKLATPARFSARVGDQLDIVVEAAGYKTVQASLSVTELSTRSRIDLAPLPVRLVVRPFPPDAEIRVDGALYGPSTEVVPDQVTQVVVSHPKHEPTTLTVIAKPREPMTLDVTLTAVPVDDAVRPSRDGTRKSANKPVLRAAPTGLLVLSSQPSYAEVYVDGRRLSSVTPVRESLEEGGHRITVRSGGAEKSISVTIVADQVVRKHIDLQ